MHLRQGAPHCAQVMISPGTEHLQNLQGSSSLILAAFKTSTTCPCRDVLQGSCSMSAAPFQARACREEPSDSGGRCSQSHPGALHKILIFICTAPRPWPNTRASALSVHANTQQLQCIGPCPRHERHRAASAHLHYSDTGLHLEGDGRTVGAAHSNLHFASLLGGCAAACAGSTACCLSRRACRCSCEVAWLCGRGGARYSSSGPALCYRRDG